MEIVKSVKWECVVTSCSLPLIYPERLYLFGNCGRKEMLWDWGIAAVPAQVRAPLESATGALLPVCRVPPVGLVSCDLALGPQELAECRASVLVTLCAVSFSFLRCVGARPRGRMEDG